MSTQISDNYSPTVVTPTKNNTNRRSLSLVTTRDELLVMAREEYARQLSRFTESQLKKEEQHIGSDDDLEQQQQQQQQQQPYPHLHLQHYFNRLTSNNYFMIQSTSISTTSPMDIHHHHDTTTKDNDKKQQAIV
ncbi:hypothetical protein BDA99DRAFT_533822 [Phascolomyces articulosus]|uniref:Uncharacterized protein n=1 Tax=Phascolomyces articulosus TaxID=60185 RepID=A0AAD5K7Q9_9FUNG|nr:hypothetical protein BDA99DRAFT_533822 [Phascolomyces articulosus]